MFKNIFCYTTYMACTTYMFNNISMWSTTYICYWILKDIYILYHRTTCMWSLGNIFINTPPSITPFVALSADQSVVYWKFQFIVSSQHFDCTTSTLRLFFKRDNVFYLLCTRPSMVSLLRNTQGHSDTSGDLYVWVCMCVCGKWDHTSLSRRKLHCAFPRLGPHCSNSNWCTPKQAWSSWAAW